MADIQRVYDKFKTVDLNAYQREPITYFVKIKMEVSVNLPTSFGKSLIYQALLLAFNPLQNEFQAFC